MFSNQNSVLDSLELNLNKFVLTESRIELINPDLIRCNRVRNQYLCRNMYKNAY